MQPDYVTWVIAIVGGYLVGSTPFGVIVSRLAGAEDPRRIGSGNIGATNVLRTGRKDLAALTLLGDAGKGVFCVLVARFLIHDEWVVAATGAASFIGHVFPVWLRFKGGKGVATGAGLLLSACWPAGLLCAAAWLATAFIFRISSLAALVACALAPLFVLLTDQPRPMVYLALFIALLVFLRHHENIRRLLKGEEPKIGGKAA
ncbi:MAG: glycerol-3-phosphate 1-O-acyltransferase PlsY [Caulobacteraceae bacterium]|nr:glycerol-3-phosphate 1-O-acyltransferase PlsY [Caulobacteraceae bacterium]